MASTSAAGPSSTAGTASSADFAADPRIHFNQQSGKWAFEADDGTEMEWEEARGVWVPVVSLGLFSYSSIELVLTRLFGATIQLEEDLVSAQQAAYSVAGVDESVRAPSLWSSSLASR